MNLRALFELTEKPGEIRRQAEASGLDPVVAAGVAKLLLANDGNLASLSPRQREHYDQVIAPLIGADG